MRKTLIAAIVAAALFAVGAFAASFAVDSEDIASGAGDVGSCAQLVQVEYTTDEAFNEGAEDFVVTGATVRFLNEASGGGYAPALDCVGATADLALRTEVEVPDGDPNIEWVNSASETVATGSVAVFTVDNVPVRPLVEVAVLANGNRIPDVVG